MNDKEIDDLINKAMQSEQELPEGLSDRLEQHIDKLAAVETRQQKKVALRRSFYWISSVAAALLIAVALFFQAEKENPDHTSVTADTFNDPEQAAAVAYQALAFMSTQLNKGLEPIATAEKEIDKINEILKQFND